jgi:hypothetical protein
MHRNYIVSNRSILDNFRLSTVFGLSTFLLQLSIIFNIAFAKGGIGVLGTPITNGYICFAVYSIFAFVIFLSHKTIAFTNLVAYILTLPFQATFIVTAVFVGIDEESKGFVISQFLSFLIFPFIFMIIIPTHFNKMTSKDWNGVFVFSIRFAVWFGLFNFVFIHLMGYQINIPGLIINLSEADYFDPALKNNLRGSVYKLISSYNNGNVFGVCMSMMLPIYCLIERHQFNKVAAFSAVFLSLSRTAWIGLALCFIYLYFRNIRSMTYNLYAIVIAGLVVAAVIWATNFIGVDTEAFVFDKELGNRAGQLAILSNFDFLPSKPLSVIEEIVFTSILEVFGLFGLIFFCVFLASPLIAMFFKAEQTEFAKRAAAGVFIYCVLSGSDGCIQLAPVMWIYNFLALIALGKPESAALVHGDRQGTSKY